MRNLIEFEYSPWLILVSLLGGALYSFLQYSKETPWSRRVNLILASGRGLLVAFIAMLLLGPSIRAIKNYFEQPLMVIALDSSESIALTSDSVARVRLGNDLQILVAELESNGWQTSVVGLTGEPINLSSLEYDQASTDLTKMIRDQLLKHNGENLGGLLVVSDGIFNSGFSPDLITPYTPIYSLGIGDTIPRKDLSIIDVEYNKTVYQDNKFTVNVKIRNEGIESAHSNLRIYFSGKVVDATGIDFNNSTRIVEHEFTLDTDQSGKHRLALVLDSIPGESTGINNRYQFYIDVIEGKQTILLAAEAPSPDMKALRNALAANSRFEIDHVIGKEPSSTAYDLIILFNSPTRKSNRVYKAVDNYAETPKLYFVGAATNLRPYITKGALGFTRGVNQYDQVRGTISSDLKAFNLVNEFEEWLDNVPPMTVPFGDITLDPNSQVVLNQKVGSVITNRPIIFVTEGEPKTGFIIGDGFWTWRLDEYRKYGETVRFDELISKLTQFLAAKPDNRQFKLYPSKDGFLVGEEILFIAETYNQLFEPAYGEPVSLNVTNGIDSWNYSFTPLAGSNKLNLDYLPDGLYSYSGATTIDGKSHNASGQFSIERPNIEAADLTADHLVLRRLSLESGGKFYSNDEIEELKKEMASLEATSVIHSQDSEVLLFNITWVLILIILLATSEWLTRKMMGSY